MNRSSQRVWVALVLVACAPSESLRPEPLTGKRRDPDPLEASPAPVAAGNDASAAYQQSYAAEAAGKLDEAISALAKLPAPQRESYLAHYRHGWLLYRSGRFADAVVAYGKASALEPGSVEARVATLLPLLAQKRWSDTSDAAEDVLKRDPENYLATLRLAFAKFSAKRFAEAELSYRKLHMLYPADLDVQTGLAWTTLRLGRQRDASAMFSEVLEIAPSNASAAAGLAEARPAKHKR
jgi:tetratricopeptide (TPR) repeat protein